MKKLFLMFAAVAALFATSCVTDTTSDVAVTGGECDVTLSVVAPGADSRAIADGLKAVELVCGVYDADWKYLTSVDGNFDGASTTTTLSMRLVKGKTYHFVFWAQNPNAPYTLALGTVGEVSEPIITVDYSNVKANDDELDAFFGQRLALTVGGTINETIYLKRPFAQINFGTSDEVVAKEFGFNVVDASAEATVTVSTMAYTNLSLRYGSVSGEQPVTFKAAAPATQTTNERLYVNNNSANYYWLAMNYILVPEQVEAVSLAQCDLTVEIDGQVPVKVSVPMAPAKRNWRTNLVGQLLTEQGNLTIEIKPMPEGELPENSAHELILAAAVGGEVTLTEDVVLEQGLNVTADMTINLNGHNITIAAAYNDANPTASSAISNNAILTLTGNGEIKAENNYTVRNYGTMVIDGVTVKNGIMNFGELTVESGNISNDRSGKHTIYGSAAKLTINGGTFHNGNPGNAGIFAYGGEVVINDGEFTIADGTATQGWTSCLLDAQGGAKYTIYGGLVKGDIRDYNKNTTVYGGTFTHSSVKNFLAAGYKAVSVDGLYYVLPAVVADAATAANVTAVTESVADVTTALATNNGEATLFTWNDVAYIAKYGEVVITSAAEEATTVRGVVSNEPPTEDPNHPLKSVIVAEGITELGDRTFRRCYNLETVVLPSTLTTIGETGSGVFQSCSSLKNIVLPESLTLLGKGTFYGCTSLETINIPAGVTRIEENCLRETALVNVEFHEGVTYFGAQAFRDCKKLKEVKILAPSFTIEPNCFGSMAAPYPAVTIYVANAEMKAYLENTLSYKNQFKIVVPNTVSTSTELQTALNNVSEGDVIMLSENFTFTEGANGTNNGISVTGAENFVLDLNGNTVTSNLGNIVLRFKIGEGNSLTNQNVTVTIKNGKVVSGDKNWCAISAAAVNGNQITLNLENVEVESNKEGDCAVKSFSGAVINAKNVTVTSNAGGGFYAAGGEIVLDNCSAICTGATSWFVPLSISSSGKMTVNSGSYTIEPVDAANGQYLAYVMNSGGELVINGGTFNGTVASGNALKACGLICADTGAKVTLNGGTYNSNGAILDMRNNLGNASKNPSALLAGGDYSNDPRVSGLYSSNLITVADGKTVAQGANGRWTVE